MIVFDLDETLYTGDLITVACDILAKEGLTLPKYTGADIGDFEMSNLPVNLKEKVYELFKDQYYAAINKKLLPGAYYLLYYLNKIRKYKVAIVTARPKILEESTLFRLYTDFPNIEWDSINFANSLNTHDSCCSKEGILYDLFKNNTNYTIEPNIYFDDNAKFCLEAKSLGYDTYLISNKHTGWNKKYINECEDKNIKVIKSILEFDIYKRS